MGTRGRPKGSKDKKPRNMDNHYYPYKDGKTIPSIKKRVEKSEKKEDISRIVNESVQYFNRRSVKTNQEIAERLNNYFAECTEKGQIPTVEDMCLALGVTRNTVWTWEREVTKDPERAEMITKAKEVLAAIDAKLVSEGKIPQVTYIFRSKNYFGMRDQTEHINVNVNPLGDGVDNETLRQKALQNVYGIAEEIKIEPVKEPEPLLLESENK